MLLYISTSGLILSAILFLLNARLYRSSVYLAGFFFLTSLYSLSIYVLYYSKSELLVSIVLIYANFSIFLHGPMLYWYIRSTLTDNPRLKRNDAWHLVPAAIFLLFSLPYIFSPMDEKLKIASELVKNINNILISKPPILYPLIPAQFVILVKALHVFTYTFVSTWMLASYLKTGKKNRIIPGQRDMTKWLMVLLGFLLILAVSDSILQIETSFTKDSRLFYTLNFLRISSTIGLFGLMISPFFFPSILYGLPLIPSSKVKTSDADLGKKFARQGDRKMKLQVLEIEYLLQVERILESSMSELKPYLKDDFNLTQLSVMINIPVHHLAYFFREHMSQSFHDYRNKLRIEHSKKLIIEGKAKGLTLEAIGTSSGFSSRNTFFIAFKRAEGITPGEFANRFSGNS
jgi:AraC-like DNA-binding protein